MRLGPPANGACVTKVGVTGEGAGSGACMMAIVARTVAPEVVLVNRTRSRVRAVAVDLLYGTPLSRRVAVRDVDDRDLAGRQRLREANARPYREIVPRVVGAEPNAVLLVVTDPPDPLADPARRLAQHERVPSSGMLLDSLRFRVHLAAALGVDPAEVEARVLGEHGTSSVFVWSVQQHGLDVKAARRRDGYVALPLATPGLRCEGWSAQVMRFHRPWGRCRRHGGWRPQGARGAVAPAWTYLARPICFMNSPLSQYRNSSNMMPSLFQWPMVAMGIR